MHAQMLKLRVGKMSKYSMPQLLIPQLHWFSNLRVLDFGQTSIAFRTFRAVYDAGFFPASLERLSLSLDYSSERYTYQGLSFGLGKENSSLKEFSFRAVGLADSLGDFPFDSVDRGPKFRVTLYAAGLTSVHLNFQDAVIDYSVCEEMWDWEMQWSLPSLRVLSFNLFPDMENLRCNHSPNLEVVNFYSATDGRGNALKSMEGYEEYFDFVFPGVKVAYDVPPPFEEVLVFSEYETPRRYIFREGVATRNLRF